MSKEIIICSAVKTTCGKIIRGHRHCDCFQAIASRKLKVLKERYAQGFITSTNRFVNREEAVVIQKEANIPCYGGVSYGKILMSENLY